MSLIWHCYLYTVFCCIQEERSRGEHNLTNITKTQERVQAEKTGKCITFNK